MSIIVNATIINQKKLTGIERFALNITRELSLIDGEIDVFSSENISLIRNIHKAVELELSKKILGHKEYFVRAMWDQTIFRLHVLKRKPDVVFFPIQDGFLFPPCKQIITVHDIQYSKFNDSTLECKGEINSLRTRISRFRIPMVLSNSSAIIAVSETTKKELCESYNVSPDIVHVVYNGYDASMFRVIQDTRHVLEKYSLEKDEYIICVASILKHKNILRLIKAFSSLENNKKLVLVGVCKDKRHLLEIQSCLKSTNLNEDRFLYLENVADRDLPYLYNGAMALALPSLHEGFGIPIIEAMACGTPVLTSNCSAMPEVAGQASILVDPYSINSIADGLRIVCCDKKIRDELSERGLERAKAFSWSASAAKLYDLLSGVNS